MGLPTKNEHDDFSCPQKFIAYPQPHEILKCPKILIVSILALITLAGCHQGSSNKDLIGQYSLVEIEKDGQSILADEIKVGDVTGFIIFKEDGTGTFMMLNDRLPFTWKDGKITGGDQTISYELDGDRLTLIISATEKIYLQREK